MEQRWGWEGRTITKNKGESKKNINFLQCLEPTGPVTTYKYSTALAAPKYCTDGVNLIPKKKKKKAFLEEQDWGKGAEGFTKENKGGPLTDSEKAMTPHSCTLAWKIPWAEEPGRLQSMGSRRVRHD